MQQGQTMTITSLISTVGTSLKGNLLRLDTEASQAYKNGDIIKTMHHLKSLAPDARDLGAEITSIFSLMQRGILPKKPEQLVFLVSDTDDGILTGSLLVAYYKSCYGIDKVTYEICTGLRDDDVERFRGEGLRNLVRKLAQHVRSRGAGTTAINATGGYKAQILFAGVAGQVMKVPVYYKHEFFDEIIALPPLPVAFDMELWLGCIADFMHLERNDLVDAADIADLARREQASSLIDMQTIDGREMAALTPAGQIFHEGFVQRFHFSRKNLTPPASALSPDQKEFREEGGAPTDRPPGIKNLVSRFFGHPCISGAFSWYYNPDLPEKNRLMPDARTSPDGITLVYSDGSATAKVTLKTTATSPEQQSALIAELYSLLP